MPSFEEIAGTLQAMPSHILLDSPDAAAIMLANGRCLRRGWALQILAHGPDFSLGAGRTMLSRGLDKFGEALRTDLKEILLLLADEACEPGRTYTLLELANLIELLADDPPLPMRGLEQRKLLHYALRRCERYAMCEPRMCSVNHIVSNKVWRRLT